MGFGADNPQVEYRTAVVSSDEFLMDDLNCPAASSTNWNVAVSDCSWTTNDNCARSEGIRLSCGDFASGTELAELSFRLRLI